MRRELRALQRSSHTLKIPEFMQVFCASDYHLATPATAAKARRVAIYLDQRFSDHAPVIIDYDFKL
jgi:hypothetical protein